MTYLILKIVYDTKLLKGKNALNCSEALSFRFPLTVAYSSSFEKHKVCNLKSMSRIYRENTVCRNVLRFDKELIYQNGLL